MGNVKSIPVIGETVTVVESGVKIVAAGFVAPFNKEEAAKLAHGAGQAWVEYSEKNVVVGPLNAGGRYMIGDKKGAARIAKSTGKAFESVVDSTPGIGHVIGIVHHIAGDHEHGNQCLIQSSRSTAVLGAGLATGGLGAGVVAGGFAAMGSGVLYDGVESAIDSEVHGERRTHGLWNLDADFHAAKDYNDVVSVPLSALMNLTGDFLAGAAAAKAGKTWATEKKINAQAAKKINVKVQNDAIKIKARVGTRTTGKVRQTNGGQARAGINVKSINKHFEATRGYRRYGRQGKTSAKVSASWQQNSKMPKDVITLASRVEHQVYDAYYKTAEAGSTLNNTRLVSITLTDERYKIVLRCEDCLKFAEAMGEVITDEVDDVEQPMERITPTITQACQCGALAVGSEITFKIQPDKKRD